MFINQHNIFKLLKKLNFSKGFKQSCGLDGTDESMGSYHISQELCSFERVEQFFSKESSTLLFYICCMHVILF